MAVFLGETGSQPPVYAARFLPNDSEDQSQTGFLSIFYKYYAFLPDSTPTLSPTLAFGLSAVLTQTILRIYWNDEQFQSRIRA